MSTVSGSVDEDFVTTVEPGIEVRSCPFCGKRVPKVLKALIAGQDTCAVICDLPHGCGSTGPFAPTKPEAIVMWNQRRSTIQ
jgi:hypothetical protein